jgi:hypothetical protein
MADNPVVCLRASPAEQEDENRKESQQSQHGDVVRAEPSEGGHFGTRMSSIICQLSSVK